MKISWLLVSIPYGIAIIGSLIMALAYSSANLAGVLFIMFAWITLWLAGIVSIICLLIAFCRLSDDTEIHTYRNTLIALLPLVLGFLFVILLK